MGNNTSSHGKHFEQRILEKMEKMNKGVYSSPIPAESKGNTNKSDKKNNPHKKRGLKTEKTNQKKKETTPQPQKKTGRRKKNKPISTGPRKGRKENYGLYTTGPIFTPIDETLCGLYDATEYEDKYDESFAPLGDRSVLRHGKYEAMDEELSGLYDAMDNDDRIDEKSSVGEAPQAILPAREVYVPLDETLGALCDVVDDKELNLSDQQSRIFAAQRPADLSRTNAYKLPRPTSTYRYPHPMNTRGSNYAPTKQSNSKYYGTYDNLYYYEDQIDVCDEGRRGNHHECYCGDVVDAVVGSCPVDGGCNNDNNHQDY